jgi:hypothetical protein
MTRQDFIFIASVIRDMSPVVRDRDAIATDFADRLGETNPRFNRQLFIQAATGVVSLTARKAVAHA